MKKRLVALFMVGMLSFSMLAGCGKDASDEGDDVKIEEDADTKDTEQGEGSSLSIDTKDFDKMMDAYKDYYNEFCEENLKPYYEDHSDCDCAARFVVNPDDNKVMMVISDIVDAAGDEMKVDLYFYEYKSGKVKEYLSIPGIWTTTDGIYVGNILNGLYVSTTTYPDGGQYEHTQYKISDGKAEEITQSKADDEEWIDINTEKGIFEYPLPYDLSGRIFTDCDSYANKYCVSERNLEEAIDFIKEGSPMTANELKVLWVDYLVENRITSNPNISADAYEYEDIIAQIEQLEERQKESEDVTTLHGMRKAVEAYIAENTLPSDITEVTIELRDGKVYADSVVDISEYMGLSSASEGVSLESEEWKPFTLTYSLSTGEWTLSPENTGALYYDALGDKIKDDSSENNHTDNGRETSSNEGAPAASEEVAVSSDADSEILQKYQDYIDANYSYNIIDNGGCVFYDIDGDGTPELLCNITAQFQTILYEDCNGDISEINGVQWYGAGDGRIIQRSEAGGIYFNYLSEGIVVDTVYIEVELEPTDNDPYAGRYYYSYGDTYEEISDSEYQSYLDEIEADNMLIPTWSLYNDVCHGSDIQGAWDLYQKYN